MNVSFEKWKDWNAVTCTVGQNTMVIGISAGPRILALRYNDGENILYEDHTGFGAGAWQMHGGTGLQLPRKMMIAIIPIMTPAKLQ